MEEKNQNPEPTTKDIFEIVEFIRDNSATKDDIKRLNTKIDGVEQRLDAKIDGVEQRLDAKIDKVKDEMINHVDDFIGISKKQDSEIAALAHRQTRLEKQVKQIGDHLDLELQPV